MSAPVAGEGPGVGCSVVPPSSAAEVPASSAPGTPEGFAPSIPGFSGHQTAIQTVAPEYRRQYITIFFLEIVLTVF